MFDEKWNKIFLVNQKRGRNECILDKLTSISLPDGLFPRKHPHPFPKPHPLVLTSLRDPQPNHFHHLLDGATYKPHHLFSVVFSQPGYLWLSEVLNTDKWRRGRGPHCTLPSPTLPWSNAPSTGPKNHLASLLPTLPHPSKVHPYFRPPLSSTNHRHKYPSQNPPHLRKWDSPHQPAPPTWHHQGCSLHQKPKASSYIMLNQGTHWSTCSEKCVLIYIFKYKL